MGRARERQGRDWRDGFLFVGNQTALDFLNTSLVFTEEPVEMIEDFPSLLRWFKAAKLLRPSQAAGLLRQWGPSERSRRILVRLRAWRESLRKEVLAWERGKAASPAMVADLNRWMADYPVRTKLKARAGGVSSDSYFAFRQPEDLLGPLA